MGAAVLIAGQFGIVVADGVPDEVGVVFDGVVALLTAFGVFQVPNATVNGPLPPLRKDAPGFGPDGLHRI